MTSRRQIELRDWIQAVSATSEPINLGAVTDATRDEVELAESADIADTELLSIGNQPQEGPVTKKSRLALIAAAAAVLAVAVLALASSLTDDPDSLDASASQPIDRVEVATTYWRAIEQGDREGALALVDPIAAAGSGPLIFGRGDTLEDQFDWFEVVGFEWQLSECVAGDNDTVECTAAGSNRWSDALEVDPITGTWIVVFTDDGIWKVDEKNDSFVEQWSPQVFEVFVVWLLDNHPDDAAVITAERPFDDEVLRLYEVNTERFVEAQLDQ